MNRRTFIYEFAFGPSMDMVTRRVGDPLGYYLIRWHVGGQELPSISIPAAREPLYSFKLSVPEGAEVYLVLMAIAPPDAISLPVTFKFKANGHRIIRPPGISFEALHMTAVCLQEMGGDADPPACVQDMVNSNEDGLSIIMRVINDDTGTPCIWCMQETLPGATRNLYYYATDDVRVMVGSEIHTPEQYINCHPVAELQQETEDRNA